jgi:hypothetical protein
LAFARAVQIAPHAPQFEFDARVSISQPSSGRTLQLPKPALHVTEHAPAAHTGPALGRDGQTVPQPPQLLADVRVLTSQPSAALPLQSAKPSLHTTPHAPSPHDAVALARVGHAAPQAPQLLVDARVSTSQPSSARLLQSAKPASHATPHAPRAQVAAPLAGVAQSALHAPQCAVETRVSTSHPSSVRELQSAKPGAHATVHAPAAHAGVALAPAGHAAPQAPQLDAEVRVSTSHPSAALALQSA